MSGTSFIASIIVIRKLGPAEFGMLQELIAYFMVVQTFENFVNPNLFKKQILKSDEESASLITSLGLLISSLGLIVTLLICFMVGVGILDSSYWMLAILAASIIFRFTNGMTYYFDAHLQTKKGQISLNAGNLLGNATKVIFSFLNPIAFLQSIAVPVQYSFTALIHLFQYRKVSHLVLPTADSFKKIWLLSKESLPLFLSGFLDMLKLRLPFLFLGTYATASEIGVYGAGVKLVEPWIFVSSALLISFWPKLVTSQQNLEQYQKVIKIFYSLSSLFFIPISIVSIFLGEYVIEILLGERYISAIPVFKIQAILLVVTAAIQAFSLVELNEGRGRLILFRNLLSVIFTIGFIYPLYQFMGILGVANSVLIADISAILAILFLNKRSRDNLFIYLKMIFFGFNEIKYFLEERKK
jgi:O-antigen/teichoic acid export membrane protein